MRRTLRVRSDRVARMPDRVGGQPVGIPALAAPPLAALSLGYLAAIVVFFLCTRLR